MAVLQRLVSYKICNVFQMILALFLGTGMTSEALGVSVAPSFFHSCVSDGKTATMEDVQRFKVGSIIICHKSQRFYMVL